MTRTEEVDVDGIQQKLGCGKFQFLTFLILGLIYSRGAWHVFGIMFLAGDPGHKCALPSLATDIVSKTDAESNSSHEEYATLHKDSEHVHHLYDDMITSGNLNSSTENDFAKTPELDLSSNTLYAFHGDSVMLFAGNLTADTCAVTYTGSNGTSFTMYSKCPYGWSYGSEYETTVLSEWDLVCDRNYMVELSITVFMFGATVGAMLILPFADRFGRKTVMLACLFTQAVVGSVTAFVNNYILFTMLRFVVGMLNIGVGLSSFVLMTETFPAKHRTVVSIAFQIFWAIGIMTVAAFGHLLRNWRYLELLLSLPNFLALPCYWFLPESVPWLISRKQWVRAKHAVEQIAKVNGKKDMNIGSLCLAVSENGHTTSASSFLMTDMHNQTAENAEVAQQVEVIQDAEQIGGESTDSAKHTAARKLVASSQEADGEVLNGEIAERRLTKEVESETCQWSQLKAILELFYNSRMRLYCCVMFFLFFVNSLGYFGISFSVPVLHGNPFINLCIIGAVEIPADIICIIISQRIGRRYPNAVFLLLCGISNIAALFIPDHLVILKMGFVMLGKFAITAAYSTVYLYSAEIFPTAVRNQAMGLSSVFENIGSICAPFIVHAAKTSPQLPLVVFGALSVLGSGLTLLLPETHNRPLPQTVQEITTW